MTSSNPFQILYVTDSPDPSAFVRLFSEVPIPHAMPMFQPGHVVLKGTQGAGKSMLLSLLKPQIRIAYAKAQEAFPVRGEHSRFLGAGINLTLSGALDVGQRPISDDPTLDLAVFPLVFADFVNYYIVRDILQSLGIMREHAAVFSDIINPKPFDSFARNLAKSECWFGYLEACDSFKSLFESVSRRLNIYRGFHQFNIDLPKDISSTKTSIGEPIASVEEALKESGVIDENTPLLIRIDQLERLYRSDILRSEIGRSYRQIINKAVGKRDSRVSYRIGTRRYAWEDDLYVFGTEDQLEHIRDYRIVDLDEKLKRSEDSQWLFPDFATDAFRRRLEHVGYNGELGADPLEKVFGSTPAPSDVARKYSAKSRPEAVLKLDGNWSQEWRDYLLALFVEDPFEAVLAAAWTRQSPTKKSSPEVAAENRFCTSPPVEGGAKPWARPYWRKERVRQCLMQIASRSRQRLQWSGKDTVLGLSSSNISVFLSVCHEIWDVHLRANEGKPLRDRIDPVMNGISPELQSIGILTASRDWFNKVAEQPGGHDRQRFVQIVATQFRKWLLDDEAMSYPGWNGFSLEIEDLDEFPKIARFLNDATDYGDLQDAEHTTRSRDKKPRKKWYINPILSPKFQIPESHAKEPYYASPKNILFWMSQAISLIAEANAADPSRKSRSRNPRQRDLFENDDQSE